MKRWRFSVYHRFGYSFFIIENLHSKIIGYLDIMLTMCFAHCICFYGFKQDQLRWIFSLLKAIYSVAFACLTIFEKYARS